jgi:pyruvate dehydrogenase E2 component (dihydrolipoamide acetyltransferase)
MAEAVKMPKTGMAMTEGTIVEWRVKEGDKVAVGDLLVEIETDKSAMEVESDFAGTVLRIVHPNGSTVPVIEVIAWIGSPGEAIPDSPSAVRPAAEKTEASAGSVNADSHPDTTGSSGLKATPAARRVAAERNLPLEQVPPSGRRGEIREADVLSFNPVKTTPLARRIAEAEKLDLSAVAGSGHDGKVFSSDLKQKNTGIAAKETEDRRVPLTRIQKITGERMFRSHSEIPGVSMNTNADVTELLVIRKQLNDTLECRITINDFVMKATAMALAENPRINSVLDGNDLIYRSDINLGMAVATDRGLLVPVIRQADTLTLRQLSRIAAEIAGKCRDGKISPDEMEGGTFTVSNIGVYGVTSFTPIINQPQAAILGVCAVDDKLRLKDGTVEARKVMGLSITFDHRIVDGAEASVFFSRIRELLERPLEIMA